MMLKIYPKQWGTVTEIHQTGNQHIILVFEDTPWNWSARLAIAQGLHSLTLWGVRLFCQDGAWGYIDTSQLREFPSAERREEVALNLLKELRISPAEYCTINNPDKHILLCGVEDRELLAKATKLWKEMQLEPNGSFGLFTSTKSPRKMRAFCDLELDRASAIVRNMITKMDSNCLPVATLVCCGNLPKLVCNLLKANNISYAKIIPNKNSVDNSEEYLRLSKGGRSIFEDLLSKVSSEEAVPKNSNWEEYHVGNQYDMEKKFEASADFKTLFPELYTLLSSSDFKKLTLEEKMQIIEPFKRIPFSMLKQVLPVPEIEEILQANARYLEFEEMLSNPNFLQIPDFSSYIRVISKRVSDTDLRKLRDCPTVPKEIKEALSISIDEKNLLFATVVAQFSSSEFEKDPEFEQKILLIVADLDQDQFFNLIQSQTIVPKVKDVLQKYFVLSIKNSLESYLNENSLKDKKKVDLFHSFKNMFSRKSEGKT